VLDKTTRYQINGLIEERLLERRRDLFSDLSLVFTGYDQFAVLRRRRRKPGGFRHLKDHRAEPKSR
jgi:hypothetical protein